VELVFHPLERMQIEGVYENRVLRRIFELEREAEGSYILR
jgi:hypothetical protein